MSPLPSLVQAEIVQLGEGIMGKSPPADCDNLHVSDATSYSISGCIP